VVTALGINVPSGIPQLDGSGKILVSQLPNSVMEYKGTWNAATNTPTLADGTGNQGDVYLCNVAGTANFGSGPIAFFVGDQVIYSGTIWQRASGATGTVTSVAVTESGDSLNVTGSPITTSGTINIGFNGNSGQYINGQGNLTTFPSLAGYVTSVTATAPLVSSGGTTPDLSIPAASASVDGYLDNADWTTFNNKQNAITLTTTGTSGVSTLIGSTLNIPNYSTDLSGYVPYTGATANVNLGTFDLTADVITGATGSFASSGGSNTFTINHSSGSGISLNITKGGNGEGLYINKTSGSGNAATIIGTLNATTLVKSGGTSSQFLKADGSVDASAYITLTSLSGGTGITYNNTTGVITNSAPDQTVSLTQGAGISISGTYPSFTIASTITQYTDALARAALSFTAGSGAYNSTTGVITIPTNNNQITNGSNFITLTSLSAGAGINYNNTTGAISSTITQYTDALARAAISLTTTGTSGAATYNSTTGVFNIPNYAPDLSGYLPLSGGTMTGAITLVNGAIGINVGDDATISDRNIANTMFVAGIQNSDRGYINFSSTSGNSLGATNGGNLTWRGNDVGTVTSVGLSSATSGVTIGSTPITTSGTITLAIATSSGSQNGLLSSTDWTTFNNKYNLPSLTSGSVLFSNGSTIAQDNANFFWDDTNNRLGIGTATPSFSLDVVKAGANAIRAYNSDSGSVDAYFIAQNTTTAALFGTNNVGPYLYTASALDMQFYTSAIERMRIFSDGNILIGNAATNAGYKLDVSGTGRFSDQLIVKTNASAQGISIWGRSDDFSVLRFKTSDGATTKATIYTNPSDLIFETAGTTRLTIASTGAATFASSIAATSATFSGRLSATGNDFHSLIVDQGSAQLKLERITTSAGLMYIGADNVGFKVFDSGFATRLTLTSGGNLGLGVTPSAWASGYNVFQFGVSSTQTSALFSNGVNDFWSVSNTYFDGTNFKRVATGTATGYEQVNGSHKWYQVASDSAGTNISFTQAMTLFSTGNLAVGTTTDAGYKLDVNGTGRFSGALSITNDSTGELFTICSSAGNYIKMGGVSSGTTYLYSFETAFNIGNIFSGGSLNLYAGNASRVQIASSGAASFSSSVSASVFNGNLTVGSATVGGQVKLDYGANVVSRSWRLISDAYNYGDFSIQQSTTQTGSTYTDKLLISANGNVGIGTSSPQSILDIRSTNIPRIQLVKNGIIGWFLGDTQQDASNLFSIGTDSGSNFRILNITNTGNVLIGTTTGVSGGGALQVNGNVNINGVFQINGVTIGGGGGSGVTGAGTTNYIPKWSGSTSLGNSIIYENSGKVTVGGTNGDHRFNVIGPSGAGIEIDNFSSTNAFILGYNRNTTSYNDISFLTNGSNNTLILKTSGAVLINRITEAGYTFDVNGTGRFTGQLTGTDALFAGSVTASGGFFDTSDSRLKILVKDYEQPKGIENVAARMYVKNSKQELGYYAQDLQEILPSAVGEGSDGFLTLSYSQVHTAKIAHLEKEVAELKELIKSLIK
jgi:hypothetical protein